MNNGNLSSKFLKTTEILIKKISANKCSFEFPRDDDDEISDNVDVVVAFSEERSHER